MTQEEGKCFAQLLNHVPDHRTHERKWLHGAWIWVPKEPYNPMPLYAKLIFVGIGFFLLILALLSLSCRLMDYSPFMPVIHI